MTRPTAAAAQASIGEQRLSELISGYSPLAGIPDEFIGPDGKPRNEWLRFLRALMQIDAEDIESRFATADHHIHDTGVSYRAYGESSDRAWPLSHVPLLINEDEWAQIEVGVTQRARMHEAALTDIFGEGNLVREGVLPASAITGSPDFLPPLVGIKPGGGKFLNFFGVDIGRAPDGRWWVLGDRTQAPSGAGYALANRLVLSRAFPGIYREMNVERLAPFFQAFRDGLASLGKRADPRICMLTPGPYSQTYFEQAYLARYLGYLLVEGGDLTVRDGQAHVRTIAGLRRADVLWRHIDSDFADPLELNPASQLGVPGLVDAARRGGLVIANALGSGVLEAPALQSFTGRLCERLLGEQLHIPNIATWWCGQSEARRHVLENLDTMAISGAFGNAVADARAGQSVVVSTLSPQARARLVNQIEERGIDFVGQEIVHLSTTPAWDNGRLTPRPFVLRVFAASTPEGWKLLPGGFARISDQTDARAVSMGEGVQSADVWVIASKPVAQTTLLPSEGNARIRRIMGNLPSRAADNLFWFGRYLERAEATLRLIRCLAGRLINTDALAGGADIAGIVGLLGGSGAVPLKQAATMAPLRVAAVALYSTDDFGSARSILEDARRAASFIRERLSFDTWKLLGALEILFDCDPGKPLTEAEANDAADMALRLLTSISGLAQENMNRLSGWRFLEAGRRIERGASVCRFARTFAKASSPAECLDVLLDLVDCQITYRSRYLTGVSLRPIHDMVLLDPYNPRSVAFQAERLREHLEILPMLNDDGMLEAPRKQVLQLSSDIAILNAADIDNEKILLIEQRLMGLADALAVRYFLQGPNSAVEDKMTGLA